MISFQSLTELDVNEHHHAQVYNYIRFARYQRGQRMRAVDFCFEELKSTRFVVYLSDIILLYI